MKSYGQREFILAHLDAQKKPFPHEDFRAFRQKRLAAMEVLFGVQISPATVSRERAALFLLFSAVARSTWPSRATTAGSRQVFWRW